MNRPPSDHHQIREIGSAILRARYRKKISRNALSRMTGINKTTIGRIEYGCNAEMFSVLRLCEELGLKVHVEEGFSR